MRSLGASVYRAEAKTKIQQGSCFQFVPESPTEIKSNINGIRIHVPDITYCLESSIEICCLAKGTIKDGVCCPNEIQENERFLEGNKMVHTHSVQISMWPTAEPPHIIQPRSQGLFGFGGEKGKGPASAGQVCIPSPPPNPERPWERG